MPSPTTPYRMRIDVEHTSRRRVFAERIPLHELASASVLDLLATRGLELVAAVRPNDVGKAARVVERCRDRGLRLALWPMLDDADGRWLSLHNQAAFIALCDELMAALRRDGALPHEIVLDLEPPLARLQRAVHGHVGGMRPLALEPGAIAELLARVRALGVVPWAAVVPFVLADGARPGWQRLLGTPVDGLDLACVSPMLYTTLAQGYAHGWLSRGDALALLDVAARACRARFGARAAASLGAVGPGALGDEATYADPRELAEDVAVVRAAGIEDLSLFELRGVLDRGPPERWLDAFCSHAPTANGNAARRRSRRARLVTAISVGIARCASLWPPRG